MIDIPDQNQDYTRFKTPYYRITIAPYNNPKNSVALPDELYKLLQKVEITESSSLADTCVLENFSLVFIEGSREPYAAEDVVDTSDLYGAKLTNESGMLTDLRFSNNGSEITALSMAAESAISSVSTLVSGTSGATLNIDNNITYLFQEGNVVTIEWGYIEDPTNVRIIANPILMVQSDFPEAGQPTTTVACQSPVMLLDQITTPFGKNYKVISGLALNEIGEPIVDYSDISTLALLTMYSAEHGIDLRISTAILNDTLDANASKVWHAGMSFSEFLKKLAKLSNCIFRVYINPKNNYKYTLEFINRVDYLTRTTIPEDDIPLLTYKGPGSILKSFSVRADFAGLPNTASAGLSSSGKTNIALSGDGKNQVVQYSNDSKLINSDAASKSDTANSLVTSEVNSNDSNINITTNKVKINPMADSVKVLNDTTLADFGRCGNKQISVEFTMLGYTEIFAGQTVTFYNVGTRYSKSYFVQTVTHTIDSAGYNLRGSAFGNNVGGLTGIIPSAPQSPEAAKQKISVLQFSPPGGSNIIDPVTQSQNDKFKNR